MEFFEEFQDPYLGLLEGRGVFLAGIVLGMIACGQAGKGGAIDSSPMYKQLHFGRVQRRELFRQMARVPELTRVYPIPYAWLVERLCAEAGKYLLEGNPKEIGINGNFVFSIAFLNHWDYFYRIFPEMARNEQAKKAEGTGEDVKMHTEQTGGNI